MERCTEWRGEHAAVMTHNVNYVDRLARYEDTGLEPDEIQEAVDLVTFSGADIPQELKRWVERCTWHVRQCNHLRDELDRAKKELSELRSRLEDEREPEARSEMTLQEAIEHLDVSIPRIRAGGCEKCAREHEQLKRWLEELDSLRAKQEAGKKMLAPEDLWKMGGQPVWIEGLDLDGHPLGIGCWEIVDHADESFLHTQTETLKMEYRGMTWGPYRCPPMEEERHDD